jgi:hypothetical protein
MNNPEFSAGARSEKRRLLERHLLLVNARGRWADFGCYSLIQ